MDRRGAMIELGRYYEEGVRPSEDAIKEAIKTMQYYEMEMAKAYQNGFMAAYQKYRSVPGNLSVADIEKYVKQGREEVWDAMKKMHLYPDEGGMGGDHFMECFGYEYFDMDIWRVFTGTSFVEKLRVYEDMMEAKNEQNRSNSRTETAQE